MLHLFYTFSFYRSLDFRVLNAKAKPYWKTVLAYACPDIIWESKLSIFLDLKLVLVWNISFRDVLKCQLSVVLLRTAENNNFHDKISNKFLFTKFVIQTVLFKTYYKIINSKNCTKNSKKLVIFRYLKLFSLLLIFLCT